MSVCRMLAALLGATALGAFATSAYAQTGEAATTASPEDAAARIELMQAQIEAMQKQLDELKKVAKAAAPATAAWKGAPEFKGDGFTFKLRGRMQYDIGYIENPDDAIATANLGFNSRIRRARLGVVGTLPGNFAYKAEVDFANNSVSWADLLLSYQAPDSPLSFTVGHHETFQSLEQMTSSNNIAFLERAQMNDAYGHGRRLGASVGYAQGDFRVNAGLFNDSINGTFNNDEWLFGTRATYSPMWGENQLHFGANYQHREFSSSALNFRYRARPFLTTTDVRFVDTNAFAADSDDIFGLELAGIFGPLHAAAEAQWAKPDGFRADRTFTGNDTPGTPNRLAEDPTFMSWYVEAGYWLTGERRGYKNGAWDRTKVLNGFDKGGWGAFGINARYDHLDLASTALYTGGIGTSLARGGQQDGYLFSLIWQPIDYVRIMAQYSHAEIEGGPFAAVVEPGSTVPINDRSYGVDAVAMRFQFDF